MPAPITQQELDYLKSFLDAGDRGGFYMGYYNITSSESAGNLQAIEQGMISTFSEGVGGTAYIANYMLAEFLNNSDYTGEAAGTYKGIYSLSQQVAIFAYNAIEEDLMHGSNDGTQDGFISDAVVLGSASAAWAANNLQDWFPGNALFWREHVAQNVQPDFLAELSYAAKEAFLDGISLLVTGSSVSEALDWAITKFSQNYDFYTSGTPGVLATLLAGVTDFNLQLGKTRGLYEDDPAYKITETADGEYEIVTRVSDGKTVAILDDSWSFSWPTLNEVTVFFQSFNITTFQAEAILEILGAVDLDEFRKSLYEGGPNHGGDYHPTVSQEPFTSVKYKMSAEGTPGHDQIYGKDDIFDGGADDSIHAGDGDDAVFGGDGDDTINGGKGDDLLYGGEDDDSLIGGEGNDVLRGGEGDDTLEGESGDDTLLGGVGADILYGGEGADYLDGGAGDDTIVAGAGDVVAAGEAGDRLYLNVFDEKDPGKSLLTGGTREGWATHPDKVEYDDEPYKGRFGETAVAGAEMKVVEDGPRSIPILCKYAFLERSNSFVIDGCNR